MLRKYSLLGSQVLINTTCEQRSLAMVTLQALVNTACGRRSLAMAALVLLAVFQTVHATDSVINPWQAVIPDLQARSTQTDYSDRNILVSSGSRLTADLVMLAAEFSVNDQWVVAIPLPDGNMANYRFTPSKVLPEALSKKYPSIRTFHAVDINKPSNKGSFDLTPQGFHGMFLHNGQWVLIDPEIRHDNGQYVAYFAKDARPFGDRKGDTVLSLLPSANGSADTSFAIESASRPVTGDNLRTYKIAFAASAEYTQFHGGTVELGMAAIATMLTRVNEIFERDVAVSFQLVAKNDQVVYRNSATDPYDNTKDDLYKNSAVLNRVIGRDNYDIGHVLNTGGGGLAVLGSLCSEDFKALGMTGTGLPVGNVFYIDYVVHELGHQMGANHTFNGTQQNCSGDTRNAETAWEPGSGSSIMGYAGLCGSQNLQRTSDAHFHNGSIEEMLKLIKTKRCGTETALTNILPTVDAGNDYTIPANTPFKLVGVGEDADGDSLFYSWEQLDLGTASSNKSEMVDNGNRPLFRSKPLSERAHRYFPSLADVLTETGFTTLGEAYPTTKRDLTFRLTVRDGQRGVATDEAIVSVTPSAGPFRVTEPTANSVWVEGEDVVIGWDVADTDKAPIKCDRVDILLSTDAGKRFNTVLAKGVANNGEHQLTLGELSGSASRVMVKCVGNVFYAVNEGGFVVSSREQVAQSGSQKSGGGSHGVGFLLFLVLMLLGRIALTYCRKV